MSIALRCWVQLKQGCHRKEIRSHLGICSVVRSLRHISDSCGQYCLAPMIAFLIIMSFIHSGVLQLGQMKLTRIHISRHFSWKACLHFVLTCASLTSSRQMAHIYVFSIREAPKLEEQLTLSYFIFLRISRAFCFLRLYNLAHFL